MYKRLVGMALVFGMAATAPPLAAHAQTLARTLAQTVCGDRASIVATLKNKHGESTIGIGLSGPKAAFEVWRARRTGSWTITVTHANNKTCILATGSDWLDDTPPPPKKAYPAALAG